MNSGIYVIRNKVDGRFYVGSTVDFDKRWSLHLCNLRAGKHHNPRLQAAWNETDFEFVILERCEPAKLIEREQAAMDELHPHYNLSRISSSQLGLKRSPETIEKMSVAATGRLLSPAIKEKIRQTRLAQEADKRARRFAKKD